MIWGLVLAAIAALVVVGSTRLVVIRSKQLTTAQGNLFDAKDAELRTNLANANLEAEELRRDNLVLQRDVLRLRVRTEYRHLTSEEQTTVRKTMKEYEGQTFGLVVYTSESDSSALGDDIRDVFGDGRDNHQSHRASSSGRSEVINSCSGRDLTDTH